MRTNIIRTPPESKPPVLPEVGHAWCHADSGTGTVYVRITDDQGTAALGRSSIDPVFYSVNLSTGFVACTSRLASDIVLLEPASGALHFKPIA